MSESEYKKRQALKRSCALDSEDSSASDEEPPVTARSSKQSAKSKEKKGKTTKKVDTEAEISSDEEVSSKSKQLAAKSKSKEKKVVKNSEASSDEESKSKLPATKSKGSKSKEKKVNKNSEASSDEESSEVKRKRKVAGAKKQTKKKQSVRCESELFEGEEERVRGEKGSPLWSSLSQKRGSGVLRHAALLQGGEFFIELRVYNVDDIKNINYKKRYDKAVGQLRLQLSHEDPGWELVKNLFKEGRKKFPGEGTYFENRPAAE